MTFAAAALTLSTSVFKVMTASAKADDLHPNDFTIHLYRTPPWEPQLAKRNP